MRFDPYDLVTQFHLKFGHAAPGYPSTLDPDTLEFRRKLIKEEARELDEALESGDDVKICREAADLIYVAVGALVNKGLPLDAVFEIIHQANMAKVPPPPDAPRGTKPMKPPAWVDPDAQISELLGLTGHAVS